MAGYYPDPYDYYGPPPPPRRPSPHHHMRSDYRNPAYLDPGAAGSGLYRSRSHGHSPAPTINVYNRMMQDNDNRTPSPAPPLVAYPPVMYPPYPGEVRVSPRGSPESRGRRRSSRLGERLGDEMLEDLAGLALDARLRSRSRGRSDVAWGDRPPGLADWQLAQREAELKEKSRERAWKVEQERITTKLKLEQLQAEAKREKDEDAARLREQRIVEDYERKQREAKAKEKEEEQRIKDKIEKDKREEKERRDREYLEYKQREKDAKDEEERKYNDFLRLQKEKKEKQEREEREEEERFQSEMRKRLANMGYTQQTIDILVDEEKAKKFKKQVESKHNTTTTALVAGEPFRPPRAPVYPKIHREYLSVETLKYYQIPWEYDRSNPEYIIILRDMDKHGTDMLFEHTSRLRSGKLLIKAADEKKPEFAWYRRRSRSRSSKAPKQVEILRLS
ncbi:unnamed protein product [Zymoseptoria tritici ST99CH_3D1]|nr:unnamed protein product [Zymoseptoria tritici ST99CH_3D1]